jgi:hypothetical protein
MDDQEQVTVYNFWTQGSTAESRIVSTSKAPLDLIKNVLKAQVVEGTGHQVSRSELDAEGLFRRVATGWGELG